MNVKGSPGRGEAPATPEGEARAERTQAGPQQPAANLPVPPGPLDELATRFTPPATLPDPFPGEFRLVRELGEGAFGKVWLADDLHLHRPVALKTLRLDGLVRDRGALLSALQNEAAVLAQFSHRNLVQVYAWRTSGPDVYLVLRYVEGGSLEERLKREGPLPWELAARYIADVAEGLLAVHQRGIIHRDIKPANVLWDRARDEALLTDFGVSALLGPGRSSAGTPAYMAPEAFAGALSPQIDVYSLTATLFCLVTGEPPFAGPTLDALQQQASAGLPPLDARFAGAPARLEEVIRAGLSPVPGRRPSLAELSDRLRGGLNQSLVDALPMGPGGLRLVVSKDVGAGRFQQLLASEGPPERLTRNLKKVPRPPEQVHLRTGDWVRVEVMPQRDGYLTVLNVGPTGELNLLYPDDPQKGGPLVRANEAVVVEGIQLQPPAGRERLFAVWTARPMSLSVQGWQGVVERGELPPSGAYQATRNMVRLKEKVQGLGPEEWRVVVLELEHGA